MGIKAKWEYFRVVYERYHKGERQGKKVMLDEFCRNIGCNRKYAIRLEEKLRTRRIRALKRPVGVRLHEPLANCVRFQPSHLTQVLES